MDQAHGGQPMSKKIKKAKMKTASPKPPIVTSAHCLFCESRNVMEITSPDREGAALVCYGHIGEFFTIWSGNAIEFTVVKL